MGGWKLVVLGGRAPARSWSFAAIPVEGLLVGSGGGVDIAVVGPGVSARHARLDLAAGALTVEDLGTVAGTSVNGHRISHPTRLQIDDLVAFGSVILRLDELATGSNGPWAVSLPDLSPPLQQPPPPGVPADGAAQQQ